MIFITLLIAAALAIFLFMRQRKFGKTPHGERLEHIKRSPNFKNGKFQNLTDTPALTEGVSYNVVLKEFIFNKNRHVKPNGTIPSKKTELLSLDPLKDILVWFGHSSYFIQIDGVKILVDPVLSGAASPIKATTRSFKGSDIYTANEIPEIDYLFISHDHWDHLDYATVKQLQPKIRTIICGLGTGQHLEHWGFDKSRVIERDWNEEVVLANNFLVTITPSRHFSGRGFQRNTALWVSFVLKTSSLKIFIGGDSGYDSHFKVIGEQHGPFDLAILECGQYDKNWKYIHMSPEEILLATADLKANELMPVHWGKFSLANHAWNDPILRISSLAKLKFQQLVTPMIGEAVILKQKNTFTNWWENIN